MDGAFESLEVLLSALSLLPDSCDLLVFSTLVLDRSLLASLLGLVEAAAGFCGLEPDEEVLSGGRDGVLCVLEDELDTEAALAGLLDDDDDDDDDLVVLLVRLDVASLAVLLDDVVLDGVLDDDAFDEDLTLDEEDSDVLEDEVLLVVGFGLDFSDPPVVLKFFSLSLIVSRPKSLF